MLIRIPPYHERGPGMTESEYFWEGISPDFTEDDEYVYDESTSNCSSDDEMDYEYDEGDAVADEEDGANEKQIGGEDDAGA